MSRDDEDLYKDLPSWHDDDVFLANENLEQSNHGVSVACPTETDTQLSTVKLPPIKKIKRLQYYDETQMQSLVFKMDALQKENETLKRNIGMLYRTAKKELGRKEEKIKSLEENLLTLKCHKNGSDS